MSTALIIGATAGIGAGFARPPAVEVLVGLAGVARYERRRRI